MHALRDKVALLEDENAVLRRRLESARRDLGRARDRLEYYENGTLSPLRGGAGGGGSRRERDSSALPPMVSPIAPDRAELMRVEREASRQHEKDEKVRLPFSWADWAWAGGGGCGKAAALKMQISGHLAFLLCF